MKIIRRWNLFFIDLMQAIFIWEGSRLVVISSSVLNIGLVVFKARHLNWTKKYMTHFVSHLIRYIYCLGGCVNSYTYDNEQLMIFGWKGIFSNYISR